MRRLCAAVLGFEAIMIALAIPVAITLAGIPPVSAALIWGGLAFASLLLSGLLRFRWAYVAGTLLQVLVTATGIIVPAMFVLGLLFALLWVWGLRLGVRTDAMKRAEEASQAAGAGSAGAAEAAGSATSATSAESAGSAEGAGPAQTTEPAGSTGERADQG